MSNPIPGDDAERYCLACDKDGHRTDECWSTHGINTPQARELFRLVRAAAPVTADIAADSIDTPEFRKFMWDHWNGYGWNSGKQKCVEFIDCHFRAETQCQWPNCLPEHEQQKLAAQVYGDLYSGAPAETAKEKK